MISDADFQDIQLLIFDIDGTLTDGRFSCGNREKFFNIRDQHWLKLAVRAGLVTALLSGRDDEANRHFAAEAQVTHLITGAKDKLEAFEKLLTELRITPDQVLYAGDDVVDMPVMMRCRIAAVPADAPDFMDELRPWRLSAAAGCGTACEVVFRVLEKKGLLDRIMERYRR